MSETEEHSPSLREALDAAMSREDGAAETAAPEGQARDDSGRFASTAPEAPADDYDETVGFDRDEWTATPATAREKAKALAAARSAAEERAKAYEPLESVLAPRRDSLRAVYGSDAKGVETLLHLSDWAARDFPGFVRHMAENRGIDLRSLVQQAAPQAPQVPDIDQTISRRVDQAMAERETTRALQEFEGNAALEHRADPSVRAIMAGVLQSGAASDYTTAYSMAVKAHPGHGPKHLAAEAAARAKADADARAKQQAEKAVSAATSLRGSPGMAVAGRADDGDLSIRALLERSMSAGAY